MSAVDYADYQQGVRWIEDIEAARLGVPVKVVRAIVARQIGVAPGTLEDIRKGRLKGLRGAVERAIDEALIRLLTRQKESIEHDLAMAAARSGGGRGRVVAKAVATRDALASLIDEAGRP